MRAILTALLSNNRRFILYCLIGLSGATLDFLIYSGLVKWDLAHYQVANVIGYASGTMLSFMLNARFNFNIRDRLPLRFLSFSSVALLGCATSAGILYVTVDRLGWDKYLAKLITMVVAVVLQYNLNRLISFRKSPVPNQAESQKKDPLPTLDG